jgi:hypothetical protein
MPENVGSADNADSAGNANRAGLIKGDTPAEVRKAVERRVLGAQALYLLGAALCIGKRLREHRVLGLVQLNFAVAPRIRWLQRIWSQSGLERRQRRSVGECHLR